jgi:hypothetical protein
VGRVGSSGGAGTVPARSAGRRRLEVGAAEILAPEQERLAGGLGERVGEAVTEVQPCGASAPSPVGAMGAAGEMRLLGRDRLDPDPRLLDQVVGGAARDRAASHVDAHRGLDEVDRREPQHRGGIERLGEAFAVGLGEQDGQEGRTVHDRRGRPLSSSSSSSWSVERNGRSMRSAQRSPMVSSRRTRPPRGAPAHAQAAPAAPRRRRW